MLAIVCGCWQLFAVVGSCLLLLAVVCECWQLFVVVGSLLLFLTVVGSIAHRIYSTTDCSIPSSIGVLLPYHPQLQQFAKYIYNPPICTDNAATFTPKMFTYRHHAHRHTCKLQIHTTSQNLHPHIKRRSPWKQWKHGRLA